MKSLYVIFFIGLVYLYAGSFRNEEIIIPEEAIRFRIIANSDSEYDQLIKYKVKEKLDNLLGNLLLDVDNIIEVENIISENINKIDLSVKETLEKEKYLKIHTVSFGKNYFPAKELYGVTYEEGQYKSLVVTLGNGLGDNWWCVLFPPLCLIEAEEIDEIEYRLYVKELIEKYF